jgi:hypothetical protein
VFLFFWLFPIGTVIFEEKTPFFSSNGNGWWSRTSDDGRPPLLVEAIVHGHDWYHGHDDQVDIGNTGYPIETKKRNLFEKGD